MKSEFEEISDELIKTFLENSPLYSEIIYQQRTTNRNKLWVHEVELFCDTCDRSRPFHESTIRGSGAGSRPSDLTTGIQRISFRCASCKTTEKIYFVQYRFGDTFLSLNKCGEFPREKIDRDPVLTKFFSGDKSLLEKAIISSKNGYGIGAFAYLRQIVENNIDSLIDLIKEDVALGGASPDVLTALEELGERAPMSQKIDVANRSLPEYLKPGGANPLGKLYGSLSEGIHSLTDEECLKRSQIIVECLKYLISELSDRKVKRDNFASIVGSIP